MPRSQSSPINRQRIADVAQRVLDGSMLDRAFRRGELASTSGDEPLRPLLLGNRIRIQFVGRQIKLCSIVAGKVGACSEDCGFCSQSADIRPTSAPGKLERSTDESGDAAGRGPRRQFLRHRQFRPRPHRQGTRLARTVLPRCRDGRQSPSMRDAGELTPEQAARLKAMGVLRVNHNLETSRRHFPHIITSHTYDDRVRTIRIAKAAGLSICSGGIFGLGENWTTALTWPWPARAGRQCRPINFLNAIEGTALYGKQADLTPMDGASRSSRSIASCCPTRNSRSRRPRKIPARSPKLDCSSRRFEHHGGNYLTTFGRPAEQDRQALRDLGVPYVTFDEVEHQAAPTSPVQARPTPLPVVS